MKSLFTLIFCFFFGSLQAANFNTYFPQYLRFEGSRIHFDDNTVSKLGITVETLRAYYKETKKAQFDKDGNKRIDYKDVALLLPIDAHEIIYYKYWQYWQADKINNQLTAEILTDQYVNMGAGYRGVHTKTLQKYCLVKQDGIIGVKTIEAINKKEQSQLDGVMCDYRINFYYRLAKADHRKQKYISGWIKRVYYFKTQIKTK